MQIKQDKDRNKTLAVVLSTGWKTTKGGLIRGILHNRPKSLNFYRDSMRFVLVLSVFAILGFLYSVIVFARLLFTLISQLFFHSSLLK